MKARAAGSSSAQTVCRRRERAPWPSRKIETVRALGLLIPLSAAASGDHLLAHCGPQPTPRSAEAGPVTESSYPARFTAEQVAVDYRVFRHALEEMHAGLYRYRSRDDVERVFDEAAARLDGIATEEQMWLHLVAVAAEFRDGSTRVYFSQAFDDFLFGQATLFPFQTEYTAGHYYLARDFSDGHSDLLGAELLAVTGRQMTDLVATMLPLVPADGANVTRKHRLLERPRIFSSFYQALFGPTSTFGLELRVPGERGPRVLELSGITQSTFAQRYEERYAEADQKDRWRVTFPEAPPGAAVLRVREFFGDDDEFVAFLEDAFREMEDRAVQHLVIDLRDNHGGEDDFGARLLAHLVAEPFAYYRSLQVNRRLYSWLRFSDRPGFQFAEGLATPNEQGTFNLSPGFHSGPRLLETQQPLPPLFRGKLYVLINGGTFGASEFCSVLRENRTALFIGEEAAGGYYGSTGGIVPTVTLPHTKLRVEIPLVRYELAVSGYALRDRGLIPDHTVERDPLDIQRNSDAVLEFALRLIASSAPPH